jgi:NAD(P)-dependent dehydrogenase (short-subunit alcohol dehydrogenase family)
VASTILITGASKGLGVCLVERYAMAEWNVIATTREPSERLSELVAKFPGTVLDIAMDVTDTVSIAAAKQRIGERFSTLDVLINNAGVLLAAGRGPLGELDFEAGLRVYDVNALGPLRVTAAFLPLLEAGERRLILNVSSEAGSIADCWRKDEYFYCMSKAALNMQSAILRNYLEEHKVELLAVHPGWMRTDMGGANADIDPAESAAGIFRLAEQRRLGEKGIYFDYRGQALRW